MDGKGTGRMEQQWQNAPFFYAINDQWQKGLGSSGEMLLSSDTVVKCSACNV